MKKEAKVGIAAVLWFIGSAAVGGFLHSLSASEWMDWIIIVFVVAWGAAMVWLYNQL